MTSDISTQPQSNKDETVGSIFRQECLQTPIPSPRHERYIWQDTLSVSPQQTYSYDSNMADRNIFTQPKISSLARDIFGHIKGENSEISRDLRKRCIRTHF